MTTSDNTTIFKVRRKKGHYAALPNALLRDSRLTFEARGLLAYLLSLPEDWEVRFASLLKQSPARRTALRRIIKECISAGYMKRERLKVAGGRFQWVTEVYEDPQEEGAPLVSEASPSAGFRPMDNLPAENRSAENRSAEKLSIKEILRDESPADEKQSTTKTRTTAREEKLPPAPYPPDERAAAAPSLDEASPRRIVIPEPFPVGDDMRQWAAAECPLVDLTDATEKFVLKYSPEAVDDPPRYSLKLWFDKWRTWMRREQRFEKRDLATGKRKDPSLDGDKPVPYAGGAATVHFASEIAAKEKYATCPDCLGTNLKQVTGKGVTGKCKHERWVPPAAHEVGREDAQQSPPAR